MLAELHGFIVSCEPAADNVVLAKLAPLMFTTFQRFGILARGQTIRSCLVRLPIIQMGFHLLSEVGLVLNDARDHQRRAISIAR